MSLEEKRLKHRLETEVIPNVVTDIGGCYGGEVSIVIDWDSFTSLTTLHEIENQILGRAASGIQGLCADDFAKEAMQESFKTIDVKNLENSDDRKLEFKDGVLILHANWDDHFAIFTDTDIGKAIEAGL